jgi:hypothetical protein
MQYMLTRIPLMDGAAHTADVCVCVLQVMVVLYDWLMMWPSVILPSMLLGPLWLPIHRGCSGGMSVSTTHLVTEVNWALTTQGMVWYSCHLRCISKAFGSALQ